VQGEDHSASLLAKHRKSVRASWVGPEFANDRGHRSWQLLRLRQRHSVVGRHQHGSSKRSKGQVSGAKTTSAEVRAPVAEPPGHLVKYRSNFDLCLRCGTRRNFEDAIDDARNEGVGKWKRVALPGRNPSAGVILGNIETSADSVIHPEAPLRTQPSVEVVLKRTNLSGAGLITRVQAPILRQAFVRPIDNVGGVS
jgi:hypothetical protein